MKKKTLTLHLDYGLWYKIDALAKKKGTIPYTLCRELIECYVLDMKGTLKMEPEHYTARHPEETICE